MIPDDFCWKCSDGRLAGEMGAHHGRHSICYLEALAEEVPQKGIRVCALCPGPTATEFKAAAGEPPRLHHYVTETAAKVGRVGLVALACGRSYVISGVGNYLSADAQRLAPRQFVTRVAAKFLRPPA